MLHSIKRWIKLKVYFSQMYRRCRLGRRRLLSPTSPPPSLPSPVPPPWSSTPLHTHMHTIRFAERSFFHARALRAWLQMRVAVSVSCLCLRGSYKPPIATDKVVWWNSGVVSKPTGEPNTSSCLPFMARYFQRRVGLWIPLTESFGAIEIIKGSFHMIKISIVIIRFTLGNVQESESKPCQGESQNNWGHVRYKTHYTVITL